MSAWTKTTKFVTIRMDAEVNKQSQLPHDPFIGLSGLREMFEEKMFNNVVIFILYIYSSEVFQNGGLHNECYFFNIKY